MPKLAGPMFSLEAKGTTKKTLSYQNRPSGAAVTKYSKPGSINPFESSFTQKNQRGIIALLVAQWQTMTTAEKLVWETAAKQAGALLTGYSQFIKTAQIHLTRDHGLCAYYTMNEPTGPTINDLSGNAIHGTLLPTYPSDCPTRTIGANPKFGNSLSFDGSNNYATIPHNTNLAITDNVTIEMWYKVNTLTAAKTTQMMLTFFDASYISLVADNKKTAQISFSIGGVQRVLISSTNSHVKKWTHLLTTWDGTNIKIYINGVLDITSPAYAGVLALGTATKKIGKYNYPNYEYEGKIDEIRIYKRALSAPEVAKHYQIFCR